MTQTDWRHCFASLHCYHCYWIEWRKLARIRRETRRRWWKIGEHHWITSRRSSPQTGQSDGKPWRRTACNPSRQWMPRLRQRFVLADRRRAGYWQYRYSDRISKPDNFPEDLNPSFEKGMVLRYWRVTVLAFSPYRRLKILSYSHTGHLLEFWPSFPQRPSQDHHTTDGTDRLMHRTW